MTDGTHEDETHWNPLTEAAARQIEDRLRDFAARGPAENRKAEIALGTFRTSLLAIRNTLIEAKVPRTRLQIVAGAINMLTLAAFFAEGHNSATFAAIRRAELLDLAAQGRQARARRRLDSSIIRAVILKFIPLGFPGSRAARERALRAINDELRTMASQQGVGASHYKDVRSLRAKWTQVKKKNG
jgi:hypothetical protein